MRQADLPSKYFYKLLHAFRPDAQSATVLTTTDSHSHIFFPRLLCYFIRPSRLLDVLLLDSASLVSCTFLHKLLLIHASSLQAFNLLAEHDVSYTKTSSLPLLDLQFSPRFSQLYFFLQYYFILFIFIFCFLISVSTFFDFPFYKLTPLLLVSL